MKTVDLETYFKTVPSFSEERDYLNTHGMMMFGGAFIILLFVFIGTIIYLLTVPENTETQYEFITWDSATGIVSETRQVDSGSLSSETKLNEFFLSEFIRSCERYSPSTWGQDYIQCQLYSSDDRARDYRAYVNSPLFTGRLLGDGGYSKISNIRVTPIGESTSEAQVQWIDTRYKKNGRSKNHYFSAIITFEYNDKYIQEYQDQRNTTGFAVTVFNKTEITQQ